MTAGVVRRTHASDAGVIRESARAGPIYPTTGIAGAVAPATATNRRAAQQNFRRSM